jgi:hypothetical protein
MTYEETLNSHRHSDASQSTGPEASNEVDNSVSNGGGSSERCGDGRLHFIYTLSILIDLMFLFKMTQSGVEFVGHCYQCGHFAEPATLVSRPSTTIYPLIFVPELPDDGRLRERPVVVLMVLPHILPALICQPLRASLIVGSDGKVDLNELLRELAL